MATVQFHITTDDAVFSPPNQRHALVSVASALLPGALVLANSQGTRREALVLLLGHITECLLKSIALNSGAVGNELRNKSVRHNLVGLWRLAAVECSQIPPTTPHWVEALNKFHDFPYASRYMRDINAYSLPETESALDGVISLHALAKELS